MTTVPMQPVAAPEPRWRALRGTNVADRLYRTLLTVLAVTLPLLLLALVGELAVSAWPAIRRFGLSPSCGPPCGTRWRASTARHP